MTKHTTYETNLVTRGLTRVHPLVKMGTDHGARVKEFAGALREGRPTDSDRIQWLSSDPMRIGALGGKLMLSDLSVTEAIDQLMGGA